MSIYDKLSVPQSRDWLHELARTEVDAEARKNSQSHSENDINLFIEEKTLEFLITLRHQFTEYSKVFNAYSEGGKHFFEVKLYRVSDTEADFMLFRNQIKLMFSKAQPGVVRITYVKHTRNALGVNEKASQTQNTEEAHYDIQAELGPFREILFHYQGHKVSPEQVAKFYFLEFVKATRANVSKTSDRDLLLHQIKSLLQEKGLDL